MNFNHNDFIILKYNYLLEDVLGKDIEQTANTYNLNACTKALIKISKAELKQLR
jgi:hypothetical protein